MKTKKNACEQHTIYYPYDDIFSPCQEYYCGRVIAFISAILSYLRNPSNDKFKLDAKIYTRGSKVNTAIDATFSLSDKIDNEYLLTKSKENKIAIRICGITEIVFNDIVYINTPLNGIVDENSITLQIADIIPPDNCIEIAKSKELLLKSFSPSKDGATTAKVFDNVKLYNFTLTNRYIYSISEGIVTFNAPGGGTLFAPFSSIFELTGDFLY